MQIKSNIWLMSNSQLYFDNNKVKEKNNFVGAYTLFDHSNLSEYLLLPDKITTIQGRAAKKVLSL